MVPALRRRRVAGRRDPVAGMVFHGRAEAVTVTGGRKTKALHGTAHWASKADLGAPVGRVASLSAAGRGAKKRRRCRAARSTCWRSRRRAPRGVGLVIPTLLS